MKIGIVTTWFERGAAYVSRQYMNVLQETDDVFIYARGGERYAVGNPQWDLPNVYWGKRNKAKLGVYGGTYIDKNDFHKWIKENDIEIILFNEQRYFTALLWCKQWGIKTVAYVDYYTEKTLPLFDIYDCLICNTRRHAFAFRNNPNVHYLKWGTDISLYKPNPSEEHEKIIFFNSAGMAPIRKGTDFVIKAFYKMKDRKKAKLLIHTQVHLQDELPEIKKIMQELCSEGSLEIVEKTISAPGLYSKADVYVYPSRLDGIGLTLMEAAASGMACITIDNAPMNEFVDASFGRVCKVDYYYCRSDGYYWPLSAADVNSLTSIMNKFVSGEENLQSMKIKARVYAEAELDFSKNISQLHSILETTTLHVDEEVCNRIKKYESKDMLWRITKPFSMLYYMLK